MAAAALPARSAAVAAIVPGVIAPDSRRLYRLLAIEAGLTVALIGVLGLGYDGRDIDAVLLMLVGIVALAMLIRRRGGVSLAAAMEAAAAILAASILVGCLSLALATAAPPFRDRLLAGADAWLMPYGAWPMMAHALAPHPAIVNAMCRVYVTLLWQPFALVAFLAAVRNERAIWRFTYAWCLTLAACVAVFALMPAVAAYRHYGIDPAGIGGLSVNAGWHPATVLAQVRSGALHEINSGAMTGLIAFPSFHAAGAVLLAWGYRRVPIVGWGFVALDGAMLLTVPLIGGHYFVDVLAGIAIAVTALIVARPRPRPQ